MNGRRIPALLLALPLCACTSPAEKTPAGPPAAVSTAVPVNKYCPCDPTEKVDPNITYMYNGKLYGFCCKDCITEFKKDPAKYAAAAH